MADWAGQVCEECHDTSSNVEEYVPGPTGNSHHHQLNSCTHLGHSFKLFRLKYGQYTNTVPTIGFNCEKVTNCDILIWSDFYKESSVIEQTGS